MTILLLLPLLLQQYRLEDEEISYCVTATCYNATAAQCDSSPSVTAFGYRIDTLNAFAHRYIAVSRDLEEMFPDGTEVTIHGTAYDGTYIVADRMSKRKVSKVDILIDSDMRADVWKNVEIRKCTTSIVHH